MKKNQTVKHRLGTRLKKTGIVLRKIQEKVLSNSEIHSKKRTPKSPLLLVFMRKRDLKNMRSKWVFAIYASK